VIPVRGSQRGCLEIEPVTLFGAWVSASGSEEVRQMFRRLGESSSDATSSSVELLAAEVSGDLAYTAIARSLPRPSTGVRAAMCCA
jgi:hypothetical protein